MSTTAIRYPDLESLAGLTSGGPNSPIRVVLTVRPYGCPRTTNEFHVWVLARSGVFLELAGDNVVEERRVRGSTLVNLDRRGTYCVVRTDPAIDTLPRLFDHLAGPAAFGYGGPSEAGWIRMDAGGRAIFYRRGPLRLRAVFDLGTRLPIAASTEFGTFRWEYTATNLSQPAPPDVRGWRIEETTVARDVVSSLEAEVAGVPALLVSRLASESFEYPHSRMSLTFRTSSMPRENQFHRMQAAGRLDSIVEIAINDLDMEVYDTPQFGFMMAVRIGDRLGRVRAHRPEDVRFASIARDEPMNLDIPGVEPEPEHLWRSRIASTVTDLVVG